MSATNLDFVQLGSTLGDVAPPVGVVHLDAFDRNLARIDTLVSQSSTPNMKWRLATKSVRCRALLDRVKLRSTHMQGLMTYSAHETLWLAHQGWTDFLLGYPCFHPSEIAALAAARGLGAEVALVCDSLEGIELLERHYPRTAPSLGIILELDVAYRPLGLSGIHLGVRRSPLRVLDDLLPLIERLQKSPRLKWKGLMAYEAQVAGLADRNPFKRALWPALSMVRRRSVATVAQSRAQIVDGLTSRGLKPEIVNGGGTGSLSYALHESCLTELTAGSGLLCSHLFSGYSNLSFEPALYFGCEVVRKPSMQHVTALGGGIVASGEPGWDKVPVPVWPIGAELLQSEACGEVQTPLQVLDSQDVSLGSLAWFRPAKAGEPAERFSHYQLVQLDSVVSATSAPTYRGEGQCFL